MTAYLLVGAGGAIGAMLRFGYGNVAGRLWPSQFPHGTLVINVVGSLAMGLLMGALARAVPDHGETMRLIVAVGVLGGFTTFSAFSLDAITLIERGHFGTALAYVLLSVGLAVAALYLGLILVRGGAA